MHKSGHTFVQNLTDRQADRGKTNITGGASLCQICYQASGKRIAQIWLDLYVVWTLFPGFDGQGVHFWGAKAKF